ncbi:MAG: OmpH family outer membrane protein [Bacteroidales bacterium]|nr:OmpH family outer membrane protein [Bacteroidales bacterium]
MKNIISIITVFLLSTTISFAQKFAYVDSEYILANIPAYKAAQDKLDEISADWQKEIEQKYQEVEKMYKDYQSEKVLLSEEMKAKKEEEIVQKEKQVKDLQKKYFGQEGELYKKRQELVKPIQDEVYNAVKEIAIEGGYAIIFDTAGGPNILYSNPKNDKSDMVLEKLGYKN